MTFNIFAIFGRSTSFALLAFAVGTTLCYLGKVDSSGFVTLALGLSAVVAGRAVGADKYGKPDSL